MKKNKSKIKNIIEQHKIKSAIKYTKNYRYGFPKRMYKHKELRKYIPDLLNLNKWENDIMFGYSDKSDIEHQFARLMTIRIHDFAEGITTMIGCDCFHSIFPLMRALCESVLLLIYVNKHPEYIKKFMRKKERGINVRDIKKIITDKQLIDYYNYLSKIHHSNPISIKLTYYKVLQPEEGNLVTLIPHNYINQYENFAISLTNLYLLSIMYIQYIMDKDWNKQRKQII